MLQYISDGGEMLVSDNGNKELGLQSSEVGITCAFLLMALRQVTQSPLSVCLFIFTLSLELTDCRPRAFACDHSSHWIEGQGR